MVTIKRVWYYRKLRVVGDGGKVNFDNEVGYFDFPNEKKGYVLAGDEIPFYIESMIKSDEEEG